MNGELVTLVVGIIIGAACTLITMIVFVPSCFA